MRYSRLKTEGFLAEYRMEFEGLIDGSKWTKFRKKFVPQYAPGWNVRKNSMKHWRKSKVIVTFWCTDPNVLVAAPVDWDFLKATLCLHVNTQS